MTIAVVTSFGPQHYHTQGRVFIDSFYRFWPQDVQLMAYHEGGTAGAPWEGYHKLWHTNLLKLDDCRKFMERHKTNKQTQGLEAVPGKNWHKKGRTTYNFRFDAWKFSRKVFAIQDAADGVPAGTRLIWVDADVETLNPISRADLDLWAPTNKAVSYLYRGPRYHSECGFVGYNLAFTEARDLVADFALQYASDAFQGHSEWHDSWVFDRMVERHVPQVMQHRIPWKVRGQPFDTSDLGEFMTHHKGNKKLRKY